MEDRELARLLSGRNQPSVLEKEAVFEAVIRDVAPRTPRWGFALGFGAATGAAALAALLWLRATPDDDEFAARGADRSGILIPHCGQLDAPEEACQPGSSLGLELEAPLNKPYFALFARRPDGAVIWYFPEADQVTPSAADARTGELWWRAAVIPAQAPSGNYTLTGVFSSRPLTREQVKEHFEGQKPADVEVTIIERSLRVERLP